MKMNWIFPPVTNKSVKEQILNTRNLNESDLFKLLKDLPDENLLLNIETIAERIRNALYNNEPLIIFGHDDPDGITSTFILYKFLESCGYQKHHYFIPNRNLEHHGIQNSFIEYVKKGHYPLVITVDNGICASEGVAALNKIGCDVIVTDHHLIQPDKLPNAYGILNPHQSGDDYPFKMLAGVGLVLMLIRYLSRLLEHPVEPSLYFWAAVGSIADKVPMTDLNRIIVRYVLDNWDDVRDDSINFLIRNYNRITTISDKMSFLQYCCRIIANGREIDGQHLALRFLLQRSDEKVRLFQYLEEEKNNWEIMLNNVFKLVDTLMEDFDGDAFIYFDDEDLIPLTLLGTAATYVVNNLNIPSIFLKKKSDFIVCEGRCGRSFNMVEAFNFCKDTLLQYGGHAKAAGFTMNPKRYNNFVELFNQYLLSQTLFIKQVHNLQIDAVIQAHQLNNKLWLELEILLPYGQENSEPVFLIQGVQFKCIAEKFTVDSCSIEVPNNVVSDIVFQLKSQNMVKIIDYKPVV